MPELNRQQRAAVESSGVVLVIAGPGTGKTKTLTERIVYLLRLEHVPSPQILALTFTKKAAEEMRERVAGLVKETPEITTFHGLCYELLGEEPIFASDPQRFKIIKSLTKPAIFKHLSTRELGLAISKAKNSVDKQDEKLAKLVSAYDKALHEQGLHDFDDLLVDAYAKLQDESVRPAYQWILVDEFQDTNRLQYEILKLLGADDNLFVIGDPNQSIYGFRGASGDIFAQFKTDFPAAQEVTLTANYRSAAEIVRLSNAIFPDQPALEPKSDVHGQVRAVEVLNEYSEADWVLSEIQKAIGGGDFLRAVSDDDRGKHRTLRDFAILYRSRSAAQALQKAVEASGLPYQVVGDGSPYEKSSVQAVIAVLRAIETGKTQELAQLSESSQRKVSELLQKHKGLSPTELAEKVIATLGLAPRRELSQFLATLVRFKALDAALAYFDDIAESGFYDPAADAITLLTIHASKGLEFPVVFLIGMQEGVLPSDRGDRSEERRLFYVAVTRAKERLEITHSTNRGGQPSQVSSFLFDLPLQTTVDPDMQTQTRRIAKRQAKRSQGSLF
ncbi:MAG: ATP-dependent helicase [Candidatus Saccharimonadales bacterium]